ncbi:MAG: NUDIX hydrolase [Eubacteriales bacterium]|nr:NUDIX hydrolase [Eubacteriales bacterium]
MPDILFEKEGQRFSYRVAGICIHNGNVLLQKPANDEGYAFPGGQVAFGETHAQTLEREFQEEIGAEISVGPLRWVAEIFFPWAGKRCQQICLYYTVHIQSPHTPTDGTFYTREEQAGGRDFQIAFHWIPIARLSQLTVYPADAVPLLHKLNDGVQHFVYREE